MKKTQLIKSHRHIHHKRTECIQCYQQAISTGKKSSCVRETKIGIGQTSTWKVNVLTSQTAAALYFEIVTPAGQPRLSWSNPIPYT